MKFIIRDDDINYHFSAQQLSCWYEGITEICPISVCIPAYIKGDFFKWVKVFENHLPYNQEEWLNDNKIFKIGDNLELVQYLLRMFRQKRISISMHGVYHKNDEMDMGEVKRNFIRGAEYYTHRDYTEDLKVAKEYLSNLFGVEVCSFTPPQNMINTNGLKAIRSNHLSLCTDFISLKKIKDCIMMYGIANYLRLCRYRLNKKQYPYILCHGGIGFVRHCRLQPSVDVEDLKKEFDYTYKKNGVFVLSTHSYGFDFKMEKSDLTMKETLLEILDYSKKNNGVEYTTLHDLFKK